MRHGRIECGIDARISCVLQTLGEKIRRLGSEKQEMTHVLRAKTHHKAGSAFSGRTADELKSFLLSLQRREAVREK
jgi:hypothetical protein